MSIRPAVLALSAVLLIGCATRPGAVVPDPLRAPLPPPAAPAPEADGAPTRPRVSEGPSTESAPARVIDARRSPVKPGGPAVSLSLDGVNLSAFIDEVFGNQLKFSIEIEQAVRDKADLVSLRLVEPEAPHRLYEIAVEILKRYGVAVVEEQGRLRFTASPEALVEPPQILTGRALPQVPAGQRPIFVVMPLDVANPGEVGAQVRSLYGTASGVNISELMQLNALLISGPPAMVEAAMEAVQLFDRSSFREKRALRISPLYVSAEILAKELREVLVGQGISVRGGPGSSGALTFVPVESANALIIFSESDTALEAAQRWVEMIDQPSDDGGAQAGAYIYQVRNTTAESLRTIAETLIGAAGSGPSMAQSQPRPGAADAAAAGTGLQSAGAATNQASASVGDDGSRLVVDPQRNAIVFQGEASRWRMLQSILARLDQPARQVLIEVTLAEVVLTDEFSHGVEWTLRSIGLDNFSGPVTAGSASNAGVVWRPISSSGQVRAVMNLLEKSGNSRILSTPRLMVRSGEKASIDVGAEVPTITSQATAPDLGGIQPSILQQVQYRKTGVLLEIAPVVHSSQRVDLQISQEVSESAETTISDIDSPTIFSRRLQTALSLSDGEPIIMGGLIRESDERSRQDVPGLGRIPVLGNLFSSRGRKGERTELILLVTPYVVEDASQARAITEAVRARMGRLEVVPAGAAKD